LAKISISSWVAGEYCQLESDVFETSAQIGVKSLSVGSMITTISVPLASTVYLN